MIELLANRDHIQLQVASDLHVLARISHFDWSAQALAAKFGKLTSSALGILGLAVRWVISFAVCLWFYVFTDLLYFVFATPSPESNFERVLSAFTVASGFAFAAVTGMLDLGLSHQTYLWLAAIAFVVAFAWGKICRRLCGPAKDWF